MPDNFLQQIQGVQLTPSPAWKSSKLFPSADWPKGFAFGGWVYNSNLRLGFSKEPSELVLNIVFEVSGEEVTNAAPKAAKKDFWISDLMLGKSLSAGTAATYEEEEDKGYYFTVDLHGVPLKRMYLYDYEISIESGQKTLQVTLKDYSLILNKIYVGLIKRQGPVSEVNEETGGYLPLKSMRSALGSRLFNDEKVKISTTELKLEAWCPNCYLLGGEGIEHYRNGKRGSAIEKFFDRQEGVLTRNLQLGSYAVKYGDIGDYSKVSTLRYYDIEDPSIGEDRACFDTPDATSVTNLVNPIEQYNKCATLYGVNSPNPNAQAIILYDAWTLGHALPAYPNPNFHFHPIKMAEINRMGGIYLGDSGGAEWLMPERHYCDGDRSANEDQCGETHCAELSGAQRPELANQSDCEDEGHKWHDAGKWLSTTNLFPHQFWDDLKNRINKGEINKRGFTIDGGYVILGTEEFSEKNCGELPNISYNFTELLNTLRFHRFKVAEQTDSYTSIDRNPKFRQNYIGTLREVLEQWCGAMSLDFYWDTLTEQFRFIDLLIGADLTPVENVIDPATTVGKEFGAENDGVSVILSYKTSSTLQNTNVQRVITSNAKPFMKKEKSKDVQRYVPMLPLHPLDFTYPNASLGVGHTAYGEGYPATRYANIFPWEETLKEWNLPAEAGKALAKRSWAEPNIPDWHESRKRIWHSNQPGKRAGRQLWDVDYAMALSKYNRPLREMYVGQRIIENCKSERAGIRYNSEGQIDGSLLPSVEPEVQTDFEANCQALGFWPLSEVIEPIVKSELIEEFLQGGGNDVQDINLDQRFYKLFIGYYTKDEHEEVVSWEQRCADGMYKYGAVVQGTLPSYPYVPREFYGYKADEKDGGGNAGYNDYNKGLSIPKLEHSYSPSAAAYAQCRTCLETFEAPFNGMLIRSGNYLPTGLLFADLQNPWGTNVEDFQILFNNTFQDNACVKYNNSLNLKEDYEDVYPYKTQTWDLEAFQPKFFDDLNDAWVSLEPIFKNLYENGALIDEVSVAGVDINNKFRRTCRKIHLMILTDVDRHENIQFQVAATRGQNNQQAKLEAQKWEIKEQFRRNKEEFHDRCDVDINFEFCEEAMLNEDDTDREKKYGKNFSSASLNSCAISPTGVYKEGFERMVVGGHKFKNSQGNVVTSHGLPNSRGLRITLARNPTFRHKYPPTDALGFYYLADLEEDLDRLPYRMLDTILVYPINNFKMYGSFGWAPGKEYITETAPYGNHGHRLPKAGGRTYGNLQGGSFFENDHRTLHVMGGAENNQNYYGGLGLIQSYTDPAGVDHQPGYGNYQCYSGVWNAKISIEERKPELAEIFGEPIQKGNQGLQFKGNPTESIKVINNTIDPDLEAQMDPNNNEFITRIFDADGDELTTIKAYHDYVERGLTPSLGGLNDYSITKPNKQISLRVAGSIREFPAFHQEGYVHPQHGLNSFSVSLDGEGLITDLTYATRPPKSPEMETILNKIGPRIM